MKNEVSGKRSPRWAFMSPMTLRDAEGNVYLERLRILDTPLFGVYIHHITAEDPDRDLHNHPWPFLSIVLSGHYIEEITREPHADVWKTELEAHKRGSIHKFSLAWAHRIRSVDDGTWTLIIRGRRRPNWGFFIAPGHLVPWRVYHDVLTVE